MKKNKEISVNVKNVTIILIIFVFLFIKNPLPAFAGGFGGISVSDRFNVPLSTSYQVISIDNGDAFVYRSYALKYYDSKTNKIRTIFDSDANKILSHSSCTKLNDGSILITGGGGPLMKKILASTNIFLPETKQIKKGPDMLMPRAYHNAITLNDGRVLISGGKTGKMVYWPDVSDRKLEFYNPKTNKFEYGPALPNTIYEHTAVNLSDGNVLIIGGRIEGDFKEGNKSCHGQLNRDIILYNAKHNKIEIIGSLDKTQAVFEVFCIDDKIYIVSKAPAPDAYCAGDKEIEGKKYFKQVLIEEFDYNSQSIKLLNKAAFRDNNYSAMLLPDNTLLFYKTNSWFPFGHAIIFNPKANKFKSAFIKIPLFYVQGASAILKDNAVLTIGTSLYGLSEYAAIYTMSKK